MSSPPSSPPRAGSATSLRFWIPLVFGVFVLLGSIGLLQVFESRRQAEERSAFRNLARVNAGFMERTRLPRTSRMAERLSEVIGAEVFFRDPSSGQVVGPAGLLLPDAALDMPPDGEVLVLPDQRFALAVRDRDGVEVIFIRSPEIHGYGNLGREAWMALGLFWLLSLALGLGMSRWVALPLRSLVRALPLVGTSAPLPDLPVRRRDEIGSLARVLEDTHRSLNEEREKRRQAERLALLGSMATGIAHEIRNPAAAIRLHTELLDANCPDDFARSRKLILGEAQRLEDLVGQWMHYSRPEPPRMSEMDLHALLEDVVNLMRPVATHGGSTILLSPSTEHPLTVVADRQRLQQVFSNLVQNAIQAMPTGGVVGIEVASDDGRAIVTISDQGEGFSPAARERMGEPFYSEKEGGLGLGLAVALDICRAHGGCLEVEDGPEGGARIRVELRMRPEQDGAPS